MTGQVKQWKSVSTAYFQGANQTQNLALSDTRLKRKASKGLSQDALTEQGLDLTPAEEKLVAWQVNVLWVCAHVMVVVCAWMVVLVTILTGCAGTLHSVTLGSNERPAKG